MERAHPDKKDFKNRFWGLKKNQYAENLKKRYQFCNSYIKNKKVLDVPCGMGWGTSLLTGAKEIYGVDRSIEAIDEAKKRYLGINFITGEMTSLGFQDGSFDVVICLEGLEHITFLEGMKFLREVKRVLCKNGLLILTTPLLREGRYHSGNPYHLCEYKENEIEKILRDLQFRSLHKDYLTLEKDGRIIRLILENLLAV